MMTETAPRAEYGVDQRTIIHAWETCKTVEEVEQTLAEPSRAAGLPPMPKPIILARASGYRKQGVNLRKFKPGRKSRQVDEMNRFIADIRAGKPVDLPKPQRVAAPPAVDQERVMRTVKEMLERLQQGAAQDK